MSDINLHPTKIILTGDGSNSLFSEKFNENYHSCFGAITESRHIFINNGLMRVSADQIQIFEVGFGTGLNCLLTFLKIYNSYQQVRYDTIEPFPIAPSILSNLNYPLFLEDEADKIYNSIISSTWDNLITINSSCKLKKIKQNIEDFEFINSYHLVYFDAFSPTIQPEMWSEDIFKKLFDAMLPEGILLTYSCKGIVKRALKAVGFSIFKLPGPPGKREFLLAKKI
jgi:tRNA U34 5-methylaminomethyl-2-thiouridine-forming methyltransferase MnmC